MSTPVTETPEEPKPLWEIKPDGRIGLSDRGKRVWNRTTDKESTDE